MKHDFNKEEISIIEIKKRQLFILNALKKFCRENFINYSLSAGTLIGCIRHKGYIPWDDDIDVVMPRPDYEKFLKTFNHSDLKVWHCYQEGYNHPFAKLADNNTIIKENINMNVQYGVNIDIFPLDGIFKGILGNIHAFVVRNLYNCLMVKLIKHKKDRKLTKVIILGILKLLLFVFPQKLIVKIIDRISSLVDYNRSECVAELIWTKKIEKLKTFSGYTLGEFEGNKYQICVGYDFYLRSIFGDYMTPLQKINVKQLMNFLLI